ncbi:hypothetical protein D9757_000963 [Collybiopsis confluens]|uniref:2-amino-4-hydroxy-6-hydroxymethyldihydropteridine diphosphokinase n=1 Tax=Collybiopsis confluens TaxID=2823264 RepID=A0A8H5I0D1_9AGAR|nr:hypothetical protein D9757_000963 [Collybiopsis confluens]
MDFIRVNDLLVNVLLHAGSRWPPKSSKPTAQPINISIAIPHDISSAAQTDDLSQSINYSTLASTLRIRLSPDSKQEPAFVSLEEILLRSFDLLLGDESNLPGARVKIVQIKPPLHCKALAIEGGATRGTSSSWNLINLQHRIEDLECQTIIGVNAAERLERQLVRMNISIAAHPPFTSRHTLDFRALTRRLYKNVEETAYLTLEALTSFIALETLRHLSVNAPTGYDPTVTVRAAKPYALVFADSSEVEVIRRIRDYPNQLSVPDKQFIDQPTAPKVHTAAITLGSNIGDSFQNIELALRLLEVPLQVISDRSIIPENAFLSVVDTSFLYESTPMYVMDQPPFINCACMIETNITSLSLLTLVKKIEEMVGRQPSYRNGPRAIDLDIALYDQSVIDTRAINERQTLDNLKGHLIVPHPRMVEREFVLRPLFDMIPEYVHPSLHKTIDILLKELLFVTNDPPMERVIPFPKYPLPLPKNSSTSTSDFHPSVVLPGVDPVAQTLTHWKYPSSIGAKTRTTREQKPKRTRLMATLNVTPDSFSDGSERNTIPSALAYVRDAIEKSTMDIVDVGGYSTRPGAAFVSIEEEVRRVIPVLRAIRNLAEDVRGKDKDQDQELEMRIRKILISVDTFRPDVAEEAILAGANCINDVYAFTGPDSYPYLSSASPQLQSQALASSSSVPFTNISSGTTTDPRAAAAYMQGMKRIARKFAVPVIVMHSRGEAGANKDYSLYDYARSNSGSGAAAIEGVRVELGQKVDEIVKGKGGVRRWFVLVDPGIGFSKTVEDNLELLRYGAEVTEDMVIGFGSNRRRNPLAGYPQLVGTSRKSFLGAILQKDRGKMTEGKDRVWATAAAIGCAVQQGALVVRVHDTDEMRDVVAVADALWS